MQAEPHDSFYVGPWLVHPRLNRISGKGEEIQVEPKAMQVLLRLAKTPGEPVTKDELLMAAWPDTIVTDDAIVRVVSNLRHTFGDNPRHPQYIETIRKTGYRLVAPVHYTTSGDGAPTYARKASAKPRLRQAPAWVGGIAACILLGAAVVIWQAVEGDSEVAWSRPIPVTTYRGTEVAPALAPEGSRVAFSWDGPDAGNRDLYVKVLSEETALRLTSHPAEDDGAAWSPDGSHIAFVRRSQDACRVMIVPALGGPERHAGPCHDTDYADLAWSPDGRWLAFNDRYAPDDPMHSIVLLSVETGERRQLTHPDSAIWGDYDPAFSPDNRHVAFARARSEGLQDLYIIAVDGTGERRLTTDARNLYGHTWSQDGAHVVFSSNRGGTYDLWKISAARGEPVLVLSDTHHLVNPTFSADNTRLVYEQRSYEMSLWQQFPGDAAPTPLVTSTQWDMYPAFSPDGQRLAFASNRSGSYEIWTSRSDGGTPMRLTDFGGPFTATPAWSPDSRRIAFDSRPDGHADVFVIGADGGQPIRLTQHPADDLAPNWSQDGRWMYFGSNRSGRWQLYKMPAAGGDAALVVAGAFAGREGPDGQWLYFTKWGEPGLWRQPVEGGAVEQVLLDLEFSDWSNWQATTDGVYFAHRGEEPGIYFFDLVTDTTRRLLALPEPLPPVDPSFILGPSGQFIYARIERRASDLMLLSRRMN